MIWGYHYFWKHPNICWNSRLVKYHTMWAENSMLPNYFWPVVGCHWLLEPIWFIFLKTGSGLPMNCRWFQRCVVFVLIWRDDLIWRYSTRFFQMVWSPLVNHCVRIRNHLVTPRWGTKWALPFLQNGKGLPTSTHWSGTSRDSCLVHACPII